MCFFRDYVFVRGGHDSKNHACFHVISKDNSENELCVNQTDVNTCLEMHFQHVLNV